MRGLLWSTCWTRRLRIYRTMWALEEAEYL